MSISTLIAVRPWHVVDLLAIPFRRLPLHHSSPFAAPRLNRFGTTRLVGSKGVEGCSRCIESSPRRFVAYLDACK